MNTSLEYIIDVAAGANRPTWSSERIVRQRFTNTVDEGDVAIAGDRIAASDATKARKW